ncbi:MAG: lysyl endopeptidase [Bacteroidota bacterium]|nr:lysyl endopeptidase [Bacteroidota bacterium]
MKKNIAITILFFTVFNLAFSQSNKNILPKSFSFSPSVSANVPEIVLPTFSLEKADILDKGDEKNGHMPHYARHIPLHLTLDNAGSWTELPEGRVWRVKITSNGALGLLPLFENLYLPPGATLHAYMPGHEEVKGAFTAYNTPEPRAFATGLVHGQTCILEYFEPAFQRGKGILEMEKISHAYRWVDPLNGEAKSGSASCEVNSVCSEGDNWRDQIRSVVRIDITDQSGHGFCSGAMINNVRQDCTPYVMSAQHCTEGGVTTAEFAQWTFDFNYAAGTCNGTAGPLNQEIIGCKKIADSEDGGGGRGSDFLLLLLNSSPPSSFNVFYSGWDRSGNIPQSGVGIHHPEGDILKISTYTTPANSATWGDTAQDTHWQVFWTTTTHGHGVSEPGSSGSPMYNESGLLVGHLTGGSSCCTVGGCSSLFGGPLSPDFYGKLAFDWILNGVEKKVQVGPWLDPDNTGTVTINGINPPCGGSLTDDAGILSISVPQEVCQTTDTPTVVLQNFGSNNITSVTINFSYDNGTVFSITWHGVLAPGGSTNVSLPSPSLSIGTHTLSVLTVNPNGHADNDGSNDLSSTTFTISSSNAINLFLKTDDHGTETTWKITDGSNTTVAKGGAYAQYFGGESFNIPICLPMGCYTFTINDAGNDGMQIGENGNFIITDASGSPVYASLTHASFGASESHSFCLQAAGIDEPSVLNLSIVPNPSSGIFNLQFDNTEERTIHVFDALGRIILERKSSEKNYSIDLTSANSGVYMLHIESLSGTATRKLVVR